jgi:hypothetical protein
MQPWKDHYLYLLTDDTGMLQHSKYSVPDPRHGYTTDDNARAIMLTVLLMEQYPNKHYEKLLYRYTSFLLNAQTEQGKFRNFMSYGRSWLPEEESEDCQGRCVWAIGMALEHPVVPLGVKAALHAMLKAAIPNLAFLRSLRATAYALVGVAAIKDPRLQELAITMGQTLVQHFQKEKSQEWQWFEPVLTYSNSMLPAALFAAYQFTKKQEFLSTAEQSLDFLIQATFKDDYFQPIGCKGWMQKGSVSARFDQQPIEACETILALQAAFQSTRKEKYLLRAMQCYEWYMGKNSKHCCLIDSLTGGCYDGITQNGVNHNMGAESQISYGIAHFIINKLYPAIH